MALALPARAHAQVLDVPTVVFAGAASADWVTTYRNRHYFREGNPMISWLNEKPAAMVTLGAAIDVASVYGWKRLTRNHRRIRAIGFYAAAAVRVAVAVRNDQKRRRADRRHR